MWIKSVKLPYMPPKDRQPSQAVCLMAVQQEDQVQSVLGLQLRDFRDEVVLKCTG